MSTAVRAIETPTLECHRVEPIPCEFDGGNEWAATFLDRAGRFLGEIAARVGHGSSKR